MSQFDLPLEQLRSYTAGLSEFEHIGAAMVAISPQDVESHRAFSAAQGGFAFPMLSDPDVPTPANTYGAIVRGS